ncbi:uroporphyrinogen-III synthase [Arcobacter sp. FWKO B]|uniref:uroporphyrinogen-III synthase n=1 Tax=Arcobacter sp. FWKO B TaxID=2593672 RepID=UPI0018A4BAF5|nr:uroporphyrinogen-III synthase [Arcobacter sp. FWKO B]QOG11388.1 uroporphyrinogen-III synthase [Arcobacter sp. FWKO B]
MSKIFLTNNDKIYEGVENLPLLDINFFDIGIDLSDADALVFTSKNSVKALEKSKINWKQIPSYCISEPTATYLKSLNANLAYTGTNGHGNEFAKQLIDLLKEKKVVYFRAKEVVSNLESILKTNNIDLTSIIAYETTCKKTNYIKIEKNSTIIFTSPSAINCFFENFNWDDSFKAICIGKTTASYLPKNINYKIPHKTSIEASINLAKLI